MDPRDVKHVAGLTFGQTRWPEGDGWRIVVTAKNRFLPPARPV